MLTYQIILLILSVLGIVLGTYQYKKDSFSSFMFSLWTLVWIIVIVIALFPDITTSFARLFGFGRGLDAVYIISILILFYIVFKLYNKIENQRKRIDDLVSQLALKDHEE